jgi:hypothetical protein
MSENEESQTSTPTVPKERLDEVLGRARAAEQQLQFVQAQMTHLMNSQQRPAVANDPEMERIKEENPVLYKKLIKQEQDLKQMRAGFFGMADEQDRTKFLLHFGEKGKKYLGKVEQVLEQERQRGNVQANRGSILQYILGAEKLNEESAPRAAAPAPVSTDEAPASDPKVIANKAGSATPDFSKLSREDRLAQLQDVEF